MLRARGSSSPVRLQAQLLPALPSVLAALDGHPATATVVEPAVMFMMRLSCGDAGAAVVAPCAPRLLGMLAATGAAAPPPDLASLCLATLQHLARDEARYTCDHTAP